MDTALWIVQVVLALVFLVAGGLKLVLPSDKGAELMGNKQDFSPGVVRIVGLLEVMGAVGLVFPALTGTLPWLTSLAAAGLMLTMLGATFANVRNQQYPMIAVNVVLGVLAIFVIYGRFVPVTI